METDWVVGEVLAALDKNNIGNDTLVIFTTDNGCSPAAKIKDLIKQGHKPNGELRGHKADIFEGGHNVPFIVRWPGIVKAGSLSDRTICMTDFFLQHRQTSLVNWIPSQHRQLKIHFRFSPRLAGKIKKRGPLPFTIRSMAPSLSAKENGSCAYALDQGDGQRPDRVKHPKTCPLFSFMI